MQHPAHKSAVCVSWKGLVLDPGSKNVGDRSTVWLIPRLIHPLLVTVWTEASRVGRQETDVIQTADVVDTGVDTSGS